MKSGPEVSSASPNLPAEQERGQKSQPSSSQQKPELLDSQAHPPVAPTSPSSEPPPLSPEPPAQVDTPATEPRRRRRTRSGGSGLKLGDNLSSMQSTLEAKKAELKEKGQEEPRTYSLNPAVSVDEDQFHQALMAYAEHMELANRINLASILRSAESELYHNRWTLTLQDELQKNMVERESEMLPFLREKLKAPELFVEYRIDENSAHNLESMPYTDDQKLKEMSKSNPPLNKLQEIFKTRIIY